MCDVRFAHSPGRFDWSYLGSLRAFDVAFVLDLGDSTQGMVALDTRYHEASKQAIAKPGGRPRQREVAKKSGAFRRGAVDAVDKTDLLLMSLEHLLLLSMLQHESGTWTWGRYVTVYPAGNSDSAGACARYRGFLADESTYACVTVEELLDAKALPATTAEALRERYVAIEMSRGDLT